MTPEPVIVAGDRTSPKLPIAQHLRAIADRIETAAPDDECPLYSCIEGRCPVFVGTVPVDLALAMLIAGEA